MGIIKRLGVNQWTQSSGSDLRFPWMQRSRFKLLEFTNEDDDSQSAACPGAGLADNTGSRRMFLTHDTSHMTLGARQLEQVWAQAHWAKLISELHLLDAADDLASMRHAF